jgi:hypothetical protein
MTEIEERRANKKSNMKREKDSTLHLESSRP